MNGSVAENLVNNGSFWFPGLANNNAAGVDHVFYFILYTSIVIFIGIIAAIVYFSIKFRRSAENQVSQDSPNHNTFLEITWSVIPLILCLILFWWGFKDYLFLSTAPRSTMDIHVTAKKWLWQFEYPNDGIQTLNEIVVPVNRPVKLTMGSEDVIHSFYLPNFRTKRDVIPNRYTTLWFTAEREGVFQIFCTEYCGDGHSNMLATLTVVSESKFQEWKDEQASGGSDVPLGELGEKLYVSKGCNACHSIDGTNGVGPTWKGHFGTARPLANGESVTMDESYIHESIIKPQSKIVAGYQPVMPAYEGLLKEREIKALIEYIRSLNN